MLDLIVSTIIVLLVAAVVIVPVVYIVGAIVASVSMARHYRGIDDDE